MSEDQTMVLAKVAQRLAAAFAFAAEAEFRSHGTTLNANAIIATGLFLFTKRVDLIVPGTRAILNEMLKGESKP